MPFQIFPDYSDDEHFTINVYFAKCTCKKLRSVCFEMRTKRQTQPCFDTNVYSSPLPNKQNFVSNLVLVLFLLFKCPLNSSRICMRYWNLSGYVNNSSLTTLKKDFNLKGGEGGGGVVYTRMPWNTRNLLSFNIIEICSSYDFVHFLFNE